MMNCQEQMAAISMGGGVITSEVFVIVHYENPSQELSAFKCYIQPGDAVSIIKSSFNDIWVYTFEQEGIRQHLFALCL